MEIECPSCGESNPIEARFCGHCRFQLDSDPSALEQDDSPESQSLKNLIKTGFKTGVDERKTLTSTHGPMTTKRKFGMGALFLWGILIILSGAGNLWTGAVDQFWGGMSILSGIICVGFCRFVVKRETLWPVLSVLLSLFVLGMSSPE